MKKAIYIVAAIGAVAAVAVGLTVAMSKKDADEE